MIANKSPHNAISQNRPRVFWLLGNTQSFECVTVTHKKRALYNMASSKASKKLYLRWIKLTSFRKYRWILQ